MPGKNTIRSASWKKAASFWFDIATRIVLALFFALVAGFYFRSAFANLQHADAASSPLALAADVLSTLAIALFMFFIAYLYAVRLRAVSKFAGVIPTMAAIGGAFLVWGLLFLKPRMDLTPAVKIGAAALVFAGEAFAIWGIRHLGRSFSILPEGRKLVKTGPYRFIRHPLYLGEAISTIGAMITFLSPAAAALIVTQFLLQLARIHYEEKVLRETFPDYAAYAKRTARLIPGIY